MNNTTNIILKNYKIIIWTILIIFLTLTATLHLKPVNKIQSITTSAHDTVIVKKDAKGNEYDQINEKSYSKEDFKKYTDSVKKVYNVSKVDGVVVYVDRAKIVHDTVKITIDSINHEIYVIDSNKYYINSFYGNIKQDTGVFNLKIVPDTVQLVFGKKTHFLKPTENIIDMTHTNKFINTSLANAYTINEPKPILDLDAFVGINPFNQKPVFGIGIGFHILNVYSKK